MQYYVYRSLVAYPYTTLLGAVAVGHFITVNWGNSGISFTNRPKHSLFQGNMKLKIT